MKSMSRVSVFLAVCILLSGCNVPTLPPKPNLQSTQSLPEMWKNDDGTFVYTGGKDSRSTSWWLGFNNPLLVSLLEKAGQNNADLEAAFARIDQAKTLEDSAKAGFLPSVSTSNSIGQNFSDKSNLTEGSYRLGLAASYELDLFGRNDILLDQAKSNTLGQIYTKDALNLSILAQTAQAYLNVLALNDRVALSEKTVNNAGEVLGLIRLQANLGALSPLEVAQQENFVNTTKASLASLKQQREIARNTLAVLLGLSPEKLPLVKGSLEQIVLPSIPLSVPSQWVANRPDIASVEQQIQSSQFSIETARLAFYPRFTLSADTSLSASPIGDPATWLTSIAGGVAAPLFDKSLQPAFDRATAQQREVLAVYRKTVLEALSETENALKAVDSQKTRQEALIAAEKAANEVYRTSRVRFDAGAIDSITLLDAQRSLLSAQDALVQVRLERLSSAVDLYRAMGGGWKRDVAVQATAQPVSKQPQP